MDLFSQIEEPEREELLALRKELEEANYKYYVLNMPTLSDREFDEKMHRLQELEAMFPDMFDIRAKRLKNGCASCLRMSKSFANSNTTVCLSRCGMRKGCWFGH